MNNGFASFLALTRAILEKASLKRSRHSSQEAGMNRKVFSKICEINSIKTFICLADVKHLMRSSIQHYHLFTHRSWWVKG